MSLKGVPIKGIPSRPKQCIRKCGLPVVHVVATYRNGKDGISRFSRYVGFCAKHWAEAQPPQPKRFWEPKK